ncbi:MAG: glycosyltransferase family 2 protein [Patescibacteria group bacterium]|jgi:glycosyltransferase involved in cell wall biosynthesis|nr:glycosyltransferase family 2 protein [bacterium]
MIKFSIITCTYNSAKFIKNNIKSVDNQTFKNFEHIFIDGFSTDGTVDIIKEYQKNHLDNVKFFQLPPRGIGNAMNAGTKIASGEYLIHLHSDDSFFDIDVLNDVSDYLNNNKELDWLYGKIKIVEKDDSFFGIFPKRLLFQNDYKKWWGRYFLKFYNFIPQQATFIKKTVFEKFGFFDEEISSIMEYEFWLRIRNETKWSFYNRIISNYRIHEEADSSSFKNRKRNSKNYQFIQERYLKIWEKPIAYIFNLIIKLRNKSYR